MKFAVALLLCLFCVPPVFAAEPAAERPKPAAEALQKQVDDLTAQVHGLQLMVQGVESQRDQVLALNAHAAVEQAVSARLAQEAAAKAHDAAVKPAAK